MPGSSAVSSSVKVCVLLAEEALVHGQHDEPVGDGAGRVAEPRQLVGQDQEPRRQLARPRLPVLAVHGEHVLAGDRQQPLHDLVHVAAGQPGVRDDR